MFSIFDDTTVDFFGEVSFRKKKVDLRFYLHGIFHFCGRSDFTLFDVEDRLI